MNELEMICFEIISSVGTARSMYIEAIQEAKKKNFKAAEDLIEEGSKIFFNGHHAHMKLIQNEAKGETTNVSLILLHAEDQLMSAEGFKITATEFIELYKRLG
ncbi:PTS lactose/cellobiose transporter subunit IIA [Clostridium carnis]